jgi:hypothetical protein
MHTAIDLNSVVDSYAATLPTLNLSSDDREEYSTVLSWLQKLIESGAPKERVVRECVEYLDQKIVQATPRSA